jgi:Zn-dependent protease
LDIAPQLVAFGVVLASLTVHEWAHAFTANRLGDPTARMLGRMSLNPAVHIDLVGTILLPLIAILSNFPILGWAKPVPVNMSRLSNPKRDFMIVAAAGPASNIPPLDGGNVLAGLLPDSWGALLQGLRQYGFLILYALLFTGILGQLLFPPMDFLVRFLLL